MGVGAGLYMHDVVVKSSRSLLSPDEFLVVQEATAIVYIFIFCLFFIFNFCAVCSDDSTMMSVLKHDKHDTLCYSRPCDLEFCADKGSSEPVFHQPASVW